MGQGDAVRDGRGMGYGAMAKYQNRNLKRDIFWLYHGESFAHCMYLDSLE